MFNSKSCAEWASISKPIIRLEFLYGPIDFLEEGRPHFLPRRGWAAREYEDLTTGGFFKNMYV